MVSTAAGIEKEDISAVIHRRWVSADGFPTVGAVSNTTGILEDLLDISRVFRVDECKRPANHQMN